MAELNGHVAELVAHAVRTAASELRRFCIEVDSILQVNCICICVWITSTLHVPNGLELGLCALHQASF
eukprot:2623308-Pleurochrysis_carterae.AAC.1